MTSAKDILPDISFTMDEINLYLNYSYDIYMAMSFEELFEIIWNIKRYSLALKKEHNINIARSKWCYSTLIKKAKPLAISYNSYDKDERLQSAINENDSLKDLQDKKIENDSNAVLLEGVDRAVLYLSNMLEKILEYKFERKKNECNSKNS